MSPSQNEIQNAISALEKALQDPSFSTNQPRTNDELFSRVKRLQELAVQPSVIFFQHGSDPADRDDALIATLLRKLGSHTQVEGRTFVHQVALNRFPAAILLSCFAIGAIRQADFGRLFRMLKQPIRDYTGVQFELNLLIHRPFMGDSFWGQVLPAIRTPYETYLYDSVSNILAQQPIEHISIAKFFDTFMLLSLMSSNFFGKENLSNMSAAPHYPSVVGRQPDNFPYFKSLILFLSAPETKHAVLQAGFVDGDEAFYDLYIEYIQYNSRVF